jgi:hypothetical protein
MENLTKITNKWGDELNPFALQLGLIGFGRKWREYNHIKEGDIIPDLFEWYSDFRLNRPITFEEYMQIIEKE